MTKRSASQSLDPEAVHRKHHLFGYDSAEAEMLVPGESLPTADIRGHTVGVTTCYDLRFPELYRRFLDDGVTLALVPSAWPYPRVEHWKLLPRARALENLLYVGAVNGSASFEDASLVGRSAVYDPWGSPWRPPPRRRPSSRPTATPAASRQSARSSPPPKTAGRETRVYN